MWPFKLPLLPTSPANHYYFLVRYEDGRHMVSTLWLRQIDHNIEDGRPEEWKALYSSKTNHAKLSACERQRTLIFQFAMFQL